MNKNRITSTEAHLIGQYLRGKWVPIKGYVNDTWPDQAGPWWERRVDILCESMEKWIFDRETNYISAWMSSAKV